MEYFVEQIKAEYVIAGLLSPIDSYRTPRIRIFGDCERKAHREGDEESKGAKRDKHGVVGEELTD